jgi:phosphoribosylamine-glycine ligase
MVIGSQSARQTNLFLDRQRGHPETDEASRCERGDIYSIAEFAAREKIDLVVIGPEQPLVEPRLKEVLLLAH